LHAKIRGVRLGVILVAVTGVFVTAGPAASASGGPCPTWAASAVPGARAGSYATGPVPVGPTKAAVSAVAPFGAGEVVVEYGRGAYRVCGRVHRLGTGAGSRQVEIVLDSLQPDTLYHYRIVSRTAKGGLAAPERSFHTLPAGHVPNGVELGSVPLGGKSRDQARTLISRAVAAPLRMSYAGAFWHVPRSAAGAQLDVAGDLDAALTADPGETLPEARVTVDRARLAAYVAGLQSKWGRDAQVAGVKLVGRRAVITPSNRGIAINRLQTEKAISRELLTGATTVIPLAVTAGPASAAPPEKAVVVREGSQTLTAYLNGKPIMTVPVTTGRPALPTPIGSYFVHYRASPYTFISPWPQGSPYYYPPATVTWAMYFYDNDFLHDDPAEPSTSYGAGSEYGPYASHGCVHVPHSAMAFLYDWLPVGAPVIVSQS
jgi:lipoprotein-anchoring transpeptidase ErfK/SrfK